MGLLLPTPYREPYSVKAVLRALDISNAPLRSFDETHFRVKNQQKKEQLEKSRKQNGQQFVDKDKQEQLESS